MRELRAQIGNPGNRRGATGPPGEGGRYKGKKDAALKGGAPGKSGSSRRNPEHSQESSRGHRAMEGS